MNAFIKQFIEVFKSMPLARKLMIMGVLTLVISGFVLIFIWANQADYQTLYSNLSQEDAGAITTKLKEKNIPYKLRGEGSIIMVPAGDVYEMRLALAGEGLPRGDNVGFEVFDNTTFSTTEFVQKLNYQRALQGELARTIGQFEEVEHARVLLVMPEESLFIEDTKPPSASVLLKLRSSLAPEKVAGIVHLVSSSVQGLEPEQITVVDTKGKVLYKSNKEEGEAFAKLQTDYQRKYEQRLMEHIQTMLERIVGEGKAIVRVSADIDFNQADINEERFDPDSSAVRSEQRKFETSQKATSQITADVESGVSGEIAQGKDSKSVPSTNSKKTDEIINYEITKTVRRTTTPFGSLKRLSVAAVVDGLYKPVKGQDGVEKQEFVPRSAADLQEIEDIIKKAMGYNLDREDQIKISCMPFTVVEKEIYPGEKDWLVYGRPYIRPVLNLLLILLIFFFVIRPFMKTFKQMVKMPAPEEKAAQLPAPEVAEEPALPDISKMSLKERVIMIAHNYPERTENWIRGWINEVDGAHRKVG